MKSFEWVQPKTLEKAVAELAAGSAMPLAGGQDLLGELKEHLVEPERVVDLKHLGGLDAIELDAGGNLTVGALSTLTALEEDARVREHFPVLAEAAAAVGSVQIRNAGTLGGNLCQRPRCWYYRNEDTPCLKRGGNECFSYAGLNKYNAILGGGPSYIVHPSDVAPALRVLDAELELHGPGGERRVPVADFFTLPSEGDVLTETVLVPGEIVTRVRVPALRGTWLSGYEKFRERSSYDFALAAVAAALRVDAGRIVEARLCLGGVAPIPWRVAAAEEALLGPLQDPEAWNVAGREMLRGAEPLEQNAYKLPLSRALIIKALRRLTA